MCPSAIPLPTMHHHFPLFAVLFKYLASIMHIAYMYKSTFLFDSDINIILAYHSFLYIVFILLSLLLHIQVLIQV